MGLQINQYPIERAELGADDYLDIDYWDGSQYRTAKIKGGAVGKNYLSFKFENDLGFTIPKGTIVYLRSSSSSANYPHADLANATTELTSSKTIGAVYDDVANGAVGLIVQVGEVDNLDTSAFNVGDKLWLSNVDGQVTTSEPQTPLHAVFIGIVTRSQNGNGRIVYNIQNGYEIEELHNVTSDNYLTPQDEDAFLFFDETQGIWKRLTLDTLKINLESIIAWGNIAGTLSNQTDLNNALSAKQNTLVSGANIKTIENQSLLGSGNIDLTKNNVGLDNVDNTSDLNKPISTATQNALNAKQNTLVSGTNIKTINGNSVLGSGDLSIGGGGDSGIHTILKPGGSVYGGLFTSNEISKSISYNYMFYANQMTYAPYVPNNDFIASQIVINVTSAQTNALLKFYIYSHNGINAPYEKLYESADIDASTNGLKTINLSFEFNKGVVYWFGFLTNTDYLNIAAIGGTNGGALCIGNLSNGNGIIAWVQGGITYPNAPTIASPNSYQINGTPLIRLK